MPILPRQPCGVAWEQWSWYPPLRCRAPVLACISTNSARLPRLRVSPVSRVGAACLARSAASLTPQPAVLVLAAR